MNYSYLQSDKSRVSSLVSRILCLASLLAIAWMPVKAIPAPCRGDVVVRGDQNGDGLVDTADLNHLFNIMLHRVEVVGEHLMRADLRADGVIDVDDVNVIINIILGKDEMAGPVMGWERLEPEVISGKMITTAGNLTDYSNSRLWMWPVQPGDTLRLSIDHDNSINVNMRSFTIYSSPNMEEWIPARELAAGCTLRQVDSLKVYDPIMVPDGGAVMVCSGYWFENGRIGDRSSAALNPYTAYRLERWTDVSRLPKRRTLNVLAIGNSFTCDELSYVPYVMQSIAPDVDLHLRILMRPNGTLADWVGGIDTLQVNRYYDWRQFPGRWTTPMPCVLREQVVDDDWDVIALQQAAESPFWNTVDEPLHAITAWLRDSVGFNKRIGWVMCHAYSDSNVADAPEFPDLYTSDEMWDVNQRLAAQAMASGCVDVLLPSGTAVQNARYTRLRNFSRNCLCDGYWDWTIGKKGGHHLQEGIGPFVAACAVAGALLDQSPIGAQVQLSSTWRIPAANPTYVNSPGKNPTLEQIDQQKGGLGMDPDSQALGAWCADQAIQHPYQLIDEQVDEEE